MGARNRQSRWTRSVAVLAVVLPAVLCAFSTSATASATTSCPSFRVLHNDRIGAASFPAGSYSMSVSPSTGISCAGASRLFARFLEDYDGTLPSPWKVVAEGSGKASFNQRGTAAFTVSRSGSGGSEEEGTSPLGALCRGSYTVNAGQLVGPLYFRPGRYLVYIPPRSGISCRRAAVLFTRFLAARRGLLPAPWSVRTQTATFFKQANPTRSAFRIEPFAGAGPA